MEESPFKGKTGLRRIIKAAGYSIEGLASAYVHEDAFRQEVLLAVVLIPLSFLIESEMFGRALMISCVLLLLIIELINSAIEATVDRISLDDHRLAKRAKDIGSAAVLVGIVNLAVVWTLVLLN